MSDIESIIELIRPYDDSLVPMDIIKQCIDILSSSNTDYSEQIALLKGQIGICGSDDTQMFSRQLTAKKLANALSPSS